MRSIPPAMQAILDVAEIVKDRQFVPTSEIVAKMIEVAGEVRRLFQGAGEAPAAVEVTFSTRTLVRWAYLTWQFRGAPQPLHHALQRALTHRAEPETAAAIHGIVQRLFGEGG